MTLNDLINMSKKRRDGCLSLECNIDINESGKIFNVYEAIVSYREFTLFTEQAVLSFSVDTIGFKDYLVLNHIETGV